MEMGEVTIGRDEGEVKYPLSPYDHFKSQQCHSAQIAQKMGLQSLLCWLRFEDILVDIGAHGCTLKLVHYIPFYSATFSKLKFKIKTNLNAIESITASFCNWGLHQHMYYPPFHSTYLTTQ